MKLVEWHCVIKYRIPYTYYVLWRLKGRVGHCVMCHIWLGRLYRIYSWHKFRVIFLPRFFSKKKISRKMYVTLQYSNTNNINSLMTSIMLVTLLHNLTYSIDNSSNSLMTRTFVGFSAMQNGRSKDKQKYQLNDKEHVGYSATHSDTNSSSSW